MEKICPIMSAPMDKITDIFYVMCKKEKCALWETTMDTESNKHGTCAFNNNPNRLKIGI